MGIQIILNINIIVTLKSHFKENEDEIRRILAHVSDEFARRIDIRNLREIVRTVFELRGIVFVIIITFDIPVN